MFRDRLFVYPAGFTYLGESGFEISPFYHLTTGMDSL